MSKTAKIWLFTALILIVLGIVIFGGVMTVFNWDLTKFQQDKYETNSYDIKETFKSITVNTDTADIEFIASENSKCSVVCFEQKNVKHSVGVKDGALVIEAVDSRKWYEFICINFAKTKITVYMPKGEYGALSIDSDTGDVDIPADFTFESIDVEESTGDVTNFASVSGEINIETSTGNICVENISAGSLELSVSTGKVTVNNIQCDGKISVEVSTGKSSLNGITCKSFYSNGDTGDISLVNVIAEERFDIERSTGDVKMEACDAGEVTIVTDTGDVTGTFLSQKAFIAKSDTGRVNVPDSITGGRCEISTDTGNIKIEVLSR